MQLLGLALAVPIATSGLSGAALGPTPHPTYVNAAAPHAVGALQGAPDDETNRARFEQLIATAEQRKSEGLASGEWAPALLVSHKLLDFARATFGPSSDEAAAALSFSGLILKFQGRLLEAEPYWTESVQITLNDPHSDTASLDKQVSDTLELYHALERDDLSEQMLLAYLARVRKDASGRAEAEVDTLHQLAGIYSSTDRFPEAEQIMRRVIDTAKRTSTEGQEVIPYGYIHDLGRFYLHHRRFLEAITAFEEAERFYTGYYGEGEEHVIWIKTDRAIALRGLGATKEAKALFIRNLADSRSFLGTERQEHQFRIRVDNYLELARLTLEDGDQQAAEQLIASALEEWQTSFRTRPFQIEEAQIAYALARHRMKFGGRNREAAAAARVVGGWLDRSVSTSITARGLDEATPLRWAHSLLPDVLWDAGHASGLRTRQLEEEVFSRLQSTTSDLTGDAMIRSALRQRIAATDPTAAALIDRLQALREQLRQASIRFAEDLASNIRPSDQTSVEQERTRINQELRSAEQALRGSFPRYYEEMAGTPVDLSSVQAALLEDEALVMVVPSEFGTHAVAITRRSAEWTRSDLTDAEASRLVRSLLWDLGAGIVAPPEELEQLQKRPSTSYDRVSAFRLYQELLSPFEQRLSNKRHVFVVPSGAFGSLPFGVLVTEPPTGSDADPEALRQSRWLADRHALAQLPSVRSLRLLRSLPPAAAAPTQVGASFVGFGDPILPHRSDARQAQRGAKVPTSISILRRGRFRSGAPRADPARISALYSALPGTAPELEQLRRTLGAPERSVYLRERAREASIKELDLSDVRVIAFATHGALAGEMDGVAEPGLILTPPAEPTTLDDGYLSASEVAVLRLDAEWVILSACNTAAGGPLEGTQGLSRLSRSFFSAGARNLLASLWPVADDAAPAITVSAFRLMKEQPGLSHAEALQQALRQVRSRTDRRGELPWSHPSVWAPFILVGGAERSEPRLR